MALDICISSFNFLNKKILSLIWKSIIHCKILVQEQQCGVGKVGNPGKNAEKQMLLRSLGEDCPDLTG